MIQKSVQNTCRQIRRLISYLQCVLPFKSVISSAGATPTTSKKKLVNVYEIVHEGLETGSETEVCASDSEEGVVDMASEGHRIIDIGVHGANIPSRLVRRYCLVR